MSCHENELIYEAAFERAKEEDIDTGPFTEMDIEDIHHYLLTGELNEAYDEITYLMYKV